MKPFLFWLRKLHPEIEKFWLDSGYQLQVIQPGYYPNMMWCASYLAIKEGYTVCIAVTETIGGPSGKTENDCDLLYSMDGNLYSLEEMLRIIRLKAFL